MGMSKPEKPKRTRLIDASKLYIALRSGEPGVTKEGVTKAYIEAEGNARARDMRHNPGAPSQRTDTVTLRRFNVLGIDPETLEPLEEEGP